MKIIIRLLAVCLMIVSIGVFSCKDNLIDADKPFYVFTTRPVGLYLTETEKAADYTLWVEILKTTGFYNSMNLDGTYTCFVPDNEAVKTYLNGKEIDDLDEGFLKTLVKYHTLNVKVPHTSFSDGALPDSTFSGDYLITEFGDGGVNNIIINKKAKVIERDIETSNGIIHVIDAVLDPVIETVFEKVKDNEQYSIFVEALTRSGWADFINQVYYTINENTLRLFVTLFLVPDDVYNANGITTVDDLIAKYSDTDNITDPEDGFNKYIAYHILKGVYYFNDLATFPEEKTGKLIETYAPNELISIEEVEGEIVMNVDTVEQVVQTVRLDMEHYNVQSKNGVVHLVDNLMPVFSPAPAQIIWEVTDVPECKALPFYQYPIGGSTAVKHSFPEENSVTGWEWDVTPNSGGAVSYTVRDKGTIGSATNYDYVHFSPPNGGAGWIEFTTPVVVKGTYKLYFKYCRTLGRGIYQVSLNGKKVGNPVNLEKTQSVKFVWANPGLVNITSTGPQKVRFTFVKAGPIKHKTLMQLDAVAFEPYEEEE